MDHADAQGRGIVGGAEGDLLPPDEDLALVRFIHAEEHAHQRGFTGAVFTQQGIYLAPFDLDGHIVVGDDAGKPFGDMAHFHNVVFHGPTPFCRELTAKIF